MQTTYYYPHVSGLTLYFQRLAEQYVTLGHKVNVIAAQHNKTLPLEENINGVNVIRTPYIFKINKGLFLPNIIFYSWKHLKQADIVHLNLPSLEALFIAVAAKLLGKKVVSTYVCDITLPVFWGSKLCTVIIDLNHTIILKLSNKITSYTLDFARNSRVLKNFSKEVTEIYPSVEMPKHPERVETLSDIHDRGYGPLIGMATRFASEKGIEFCLEALPQLKLHFPKIKLVFAGDTNAFGEEHYFRKLKPLLKKYKSDICSLGILSQKQMAYFYENIDLLVVASTNSTEAFGIVQVEAMLRGTPVVATNLPGVKVPIEITGMGEIANKADSEDLCKKIIQVLKNKNNYTRDKDRIYEVFNMHHSVEKYLNLYNQALNG